MKKTTTQNQIENGNIKEIDTFSWSFQLYSAFSINILLVAFCEIDY